MLYSAAHLRFLLTSGLLAMLLLAAFFLRSRELTFSQYLRWGMLIVFIPLLGPFLAILTHPGLSRR